ncbi:hypothetical protein OG2516_04189 [Oceanicola granulosus HTCC2516]|uniref:Uncharacterized protein n=1 Tax=Oceanicola granulosus (strain ATCC BAA-861 / DSM 15982 / KCTC 12143 / HTCC2516) TaxID=314256 RepID=Q2CED1_OCEGH|nr:hypothetical protein OG2516_04189 [Oceanicola granulosus HTCC2516]
MIGLLHVQLRLARRRAGSAVRRARPLKMMLTRPCLSRDPP